MKSDPTSSYAGRPTAPHRSGPTLRPWLVVVPGIVLASAFAMLVTLSQGTHATAVQACAAFMLAMLGLLGWRLQRSHALLQRTRDELTRASEQLRASRQHPVQAGQMPALEQMMAGIAHEIESPLADLKASIERLGGRLQMIGTPAAQAGTHQVVDHAVIGEVRDLVRTGTQCIARIDELIASLRQFGCTDHERVVHFDVREGLHGTLALAGSLLRDRVRVVQQFDAVPPVKAAPARINRVFLNLIGNAAQAMARDGSQHVLTLRTFQPDPQAVCVEIQDNGPGIAPDVLPRIFDPFFSTRPHGQGTGMGLPISYRIIHDHGGRLDVSSEPGVGTTFRITLPVEPLPSGGGSADLTSHASPSLRRSSAGRPLQPADADEPVPV